MKASGFWALLLVVGTGLTLFNFSSSIGGSWFPDLAATKCGDRTILIPVSRKLKENGGSIRSNNKSDIGHVTLHDYDPINPAPTVSSMQPGPIEHGTPFKPKNSKPLPPPKPGGPK